MTGTTALLNVEDVSYLRNGERYLHPVSLTLNAGESLFLTGPSGCGKSTLLKIIASLLPASTGSVSFRGNPVESMKAEIYRRHVSYCFQSPLLFADTVFDNLAFPWLIRHKTVSRKTLIEWLQRVNLSADILDRGIEHLSGGERQRIGLLRNLQFLPDILLLDEVTSALDKENQQRVNHLIEHLVAEQGLAVIRVSHHTDEIAQAARTITLQPSHQDTLT
ncbi:MAG: putative iron export ATP-binding protein FetA [Candidatus Erwinia impunctatus]|nr:putative iron export ATP-binding protein FetA [Culicoides impunctatus]